MNEEKKITTEAEENTERYGSCKMCGQSVLVKANKMLPQSSIDNMATSACKCSNPYAQYGACKYCGQAVYIESKEVLNQEILDNMATSKCQCLEAMAAETANKRKMNASKIIKEKFGSGARSERLEQTDAVQRMLYAIVSAIADEEIESATLKLPLKCKATITLTSKGNIKIKRTLTKEEAAEA